MRFNENLIKLRKENGMSQEQLGFELNVTRQTVSKWELGISTPEMEKLIEISKLFGVSVDELINEGGEENMKGNYQTDNNDYVGVDSKYIPKDNEYNAEKEQEKMKKEETLKKGKKIAKTIGGAYIIYVLLGIVFAIIIFVITMFTMFKSSKSFFKVKQEFNNQLESAESIFESPKEANSKIEIESYNKRFEMLGGINKSSVSVEILIDEIISNNNNNENKISVKYNGQELQDDEDMQNIELDKFSIYNITFKYNKDGYINKVEIRVK